MHFKISPSAVRFCIFTYGLVLGLGFVGCGAEASLAQARTVQVAPAQWLFELGANGGRVLEAGVAAKVERSWIHLIDLPKCTVTESEIVGNLGAAKAARLPAV